MYSRRVYKSQFFKHGKEKKIIKELKKVRKENQMSGSSSFRIKNQNPDLHHKN